MCVAFRLSATFHKLHFSSWITHTFDFIMRINWYIFFFHLNAAQIVQCTATGNDFATHSIQAFSSINNLSFTSLNKHSREVLCRLYIYITFLHYAFLMASEKMIALKMSADRVTWDRLHENLTENQKRPPILSSAIYDIGHKIIKSRLIWSCVV